MHGTQSSVATKPLSVSDAVFGREYREDLVHQVVVAYRNAGRAGTKAQKTRSDMSGTTKKFKKQKGGGARHGDYRAPIFVGGGRAFAAKPRSFAQKVNRKMYRGAIQSILSELNRQGRIKVVEKFEVDALQDQGAGRQDQDIGLKRPLIVTEDAESRCTSPRATCRTCRCAMCRSGPGRTGRRRQRGRHGRRGEEDRGVAGMSNERF
jgi:large subunit ribosomal protein L4